MTKGWMGCKGFLAAHRRFAVLLAVETLCILALMVRCAKPLHTEQLDLAQLTAVNVPEGVAFSVQDGALVVDTTGTSAENGAVLLTAESPTVVLPSDAYEITVSYDSDQWKLDEEPITLNFINQGLGEVISGGSDLWGGTNLLTLDGAHHSVTGRIWVKQGNTRGFTVKLQAQMAAQTVIQSITFTAKRAYRVVRLLAALLVFAVLDAVLLLFFVDTDGAEKKARAAKNETLLVLAALCLVACLPFTAGIEYVGWDFQFHVERIVQVAAELKNGQFPVRMMTGMLNGYGYANSLYYCDIFLYLPALLYNCMVPLGVCYNIYGAVVTVCTCALTYYSLRKVCSSPRTACVGTAVYLLSGYRLVNVFMRSAVGEYTAMAFLPLVAVHIYQLYTKEELTWRDWGPLAMGMAGLVQCHILTFELVCLVLAVFAVVFGRQTFRKKRLAALLKAAGAAIGLCAWFLVPFVQSMMTQNVQVNNTYAGNFQENGASLLYLLNPFPMSALWSLERDQLQNGALIVYSSIFDGMHGTLGAPLLAGLVLALYMLLRCKEWDDGKQAAPLRVLLGVSGVLMVISLRQFPWNALFTCFENTVIHKILGAAQFPWRYLSIVTALLSICTVLALEKLCHWKKDKAKTAHLVLLATCILYAGSFFVYFAATPEQLTYTASNADSLLVGSGEYMLPNGPAVNYARPQTDSADLQIKYYDNSSGVAQATLENTGTQAAELELPIFDYGNYVVTDNEGTEWPTQTSDSSLLEVSVPAGFTGSITVRYREPVLWRIMEAVSGLTLAALVLGCCAQRRKTRTAAEKN